MSTLAVRLTLFCRAGEDFHHQAGAPVCVVAVQVLASHYRCRTRPAMARNLMPLPSGFS
jgi:hypothetical protein